MVLRTQHGSMNMLCGQKYPHIFEDFGNLVVVV
jgi:hypothetical protein